MFTLKLNRGDYIRSYKTDKPRAFTVSFHQSNLIRAYRALSSGKSVKIAYSRTATHPKTRLPSKAHNLFYSNIGRLFESSSSRLEILISLEINYFWKNYSEVHPFAKYSRLYGCTR
jgi:hypothetical protein